MSTYALFTASYGSNYANLRVRILEAATGLPAIIMASAASGILSSNGNAVLDSSGNLSVFLDNAKTFQVWNNQFLLINSGSSLAIEVQKTAAQLAAAPTNSDIGLGPGATFYLDTNPAAQYRINSSKTQFSVITGSGGASISSATPQPLGNATAGVTGLAADAGHVHALPSAAAINALNLPLSWDASANSPTLTSSVAPPANNSYRVVTPGSTSLDGISTWVVGDIAYFNGTWQKISATYINSPGTSVLKADGAGGVATAVPGTDYMPGTYMQMAIPIGVAPSGSVGSNGALTLGTALTTTYADGLWLYYPVNSVTASNAAGFYWTVMSSGTAGTVYQNYLSDGTSQAGLVSVPSSNTAWSGTTGGSYTGATSAVFVPGFNIAANTLGKNGTGTLRMAMRNNNSAGNKTLQPIFGSSSLIFSQMLGTTATQTAQVSTVYNRGRADRQVCPGAQDSSAFALTTASVNTAATVLMTMRMTLAVATDWMILELMQFNISPSQ